MKEKRRITIVSVEATNYRRLKIAEVKLVPGAGLPHRQEAFIVGLQTRFVDSPERANLMQFVGSITQEASIEVMDDGFTQKVKAKSGIALTKNVTVPSPVLLQAFRTFREVTQPIVPYALRVQKIGEEPGITLHEADGGAWEQVAIDRAALWLRTELAGEANEERPAMKAVGIPVLA